jgi:hypothetical protein
MKKTDRQRYFTVIAFVLIGLLFFGCATKVPIWGNENVGFNLKYQLDNNQKLNYETSSKSKTNVIIMGNATTTDDDTLIQFSLVGTQAKNPDQLSSQVTIDDMKMTSVQSAMGESAELERDLSKVIGNSFDLTFSPQGREIDLSGVEKLTIDMGPMGGGEQSLRDRFKNILPDLSNDPVKIGDTWTSTTEEKTPIGVGDASAKVTTDTTSKIEGFDTINEYQCLRVNSHTTGTIEGSGETMNTTVTIKGDITSEGTWYFAYEEGLLIKSLSDSRVKIDIQIGGDQGIKYTLDVKDESETKLTTPASS